ncbi:hypothetical protein TcasGA2_TC031529 [Tribolium castaneum]|uniref:Uncharacterized protein n=1 Tax=Tribolium castaneum TaxID=7070 RepID=A0A139WP63_TRICA|nr:hypothetical protein TcasGA2_TC031529 [Tribolium castaneum]
MEDVWKLVLTPKGTSSPNALEELTKRGLRAAWQVGRFAFPIAIAIGARPVFELDR